MLSLANLITLSRIALTPVIIFFMQQYAWEQALLFLLVAVLTDVLDGWVARKFNQQSRIGQILDPIADKILFISLMSACLILIPGYGLLFFTLCFLIFKEVVLLGGGAVLWFGYHKFISPSKLSRQASWYEFLFLFSVFVDQIDYLFMPSVILVGLALISVAYSCKLLLLYSRKVFHNFD